MSPHYHGNDVMQNIVSPAQRTAVKQRPHQQTESCQVATSEPVVHDHGRETDGPSHNEVRPSGFNGLLGGARPSPWELRTGWPLSGLTRDGEWSV
jgi:hypothetical protein